MYENGEKIEKPTAFDFPPTIESKHVKAWGNLDIDQKGKLTIEKNEEIYEIVFYPFRKEGGGVKFLSKINKKTKDITFIMVTSGGTITDEQIGSMEQYLSFLSNFEKDMKNLVDVDKKEVITYKDMVKELQESE